MPLDFSRLGDFDLANFGTGVLPDISGGVSTTPNNMVPDQYLRALQSDGAPAGWSKVEGPSNDGYHAYLFEISGAVRTGGKQTPNPDKAEQDSHLFNTPVVSGGPAPTPGTPGVAIPAEALEAPVVTKVSTGISGLPQGEYLAAISYEVKGAHTLTTTPVAVTINTDGKLLEFKLLLDADRTTVTGQGLWLTTPVPVGGTPDAATLRLQAVAPNQGRTFTLKGPYNYTGRLAPAKNETAIGTPPKLERPIDAAVEGGKTSSLVVGRYVFYIVQTTEQGDSLASPGEPVPPGYITFRTQAPGFGFVFHPRLLPQATGYRVFHQNFNESSNPPFYELVRTRTGDKTRPFAPTERPVWFGKIDSGDVSTQTPGTYVGSKVAFTASSLTDVLTTVTSTGFSNGVEVRVSGSNLPPPLKANTSYWIVNKSGSTMKLATVRGGTAINLTAAGSGQVFTYKVVAAPGSFEYISVSGDPPTEDTSGVADPTGDTDPPTVVGLGIPQAGTYLVGYTRVLGGQETPISQMVQVTLSAGEVTAGTVIQMEYPPTVNKIANALYGQADTKGLPLHWTIKDSVNATVTTVGTNNNYEKAGVFYVQCSGSLANTGRYPDVETKAGKEIALDAGRVETIAGWLEVASRTSGSAYIELVQLDVAKAEVGTRLTLATLAANGAVYFEKTVAGTGITSDLTLNDAAVYARLQWGAEGNPRQLRVRAHSLIWAPQKGISRRYVSPPSPNEFWTATTDPAAPWPNTHVLAIGQPPPTAASTAGTVSTPAAPSGGQIELLNYDSLTDGTTPAGWTVSKYADANTTAGAFTSALWGNVKTMRFRQNSSAYSGFSSMLKDYTSLTTATSDMNVVWRISCDDPSVGQMSLGLLYPPGASSVTVAQDRFELQFNAPASGVSTGLRDAYLFGRVAGNSTSTKLTGQYKLSDKLEIEMTVTGIGTSTGIVTIKVGVNGGVRSLVATQTGRNFTSFKPRTVCMGVVDTNVADSWSAQYGQTYIGATAAVDQVVNAAPSLTPLVQPDWPWLAGTILNGPNSSPVDHTDTTSNSTRRAVAATFNRTTTVAAERTLAQIRTSAGTELVGLYMKTDHTVELRKGATAFPVSAAVPTGTDYRFGVVVSGAGGTTTAGVALVYRTIGTGARELIVLAQNLDFSTTLAQRATVANNTELTETNIVVTESGEYTYDNTGPDGEPINQGYVSLIASDVTNTDVGFVVDEYIVQPGVERTFAVYMKPDDLADDAAPFTLVAYDQIGQSVELGSVYADGTAVANSAPGWFEYFMHYTVPEGYFRVRVENRNMTEGRYVFQKPLDAIGHLDTVALRNAARDDRRALTGTYTSVLNARVPQTVGTMVQSAYGEERVDLGYQVEQPLGEALAFTVVAATDVFTAVGHRYQTGSPVRVTGLTGSAPLAEETTYWVRDVSGSTFKLAATSGGAAINITSDGSGTITGYTFATVRYYSTDNPEVVGTWQTEGNEALVPDLEWIYAEVTLYGDGVVSPRMPLGSPYVNFRTRLPVLLRADRSALPGGVYVGGGGNNLRRPYKRSTFDEEAVGDRALARAITSEIGRLWGYTLNVFHPDALDELQSDTFLEEDWVIESPFHDMLLRIRHYGIPSEPAPMFDYDGFDERSPFAISTMMPQVLTVERAEVVALSLLTGTNESL